MKDWAGWLEEERAELRETDPGVLAVAEKAIAEHGLDDWQAATLLFTARNSLDCGVDRETVIQAVPQDVKWIRTKRPQPPGE